MESKLLQNAGYKISGDCKLHENEIHQILSACIGEWRKIVVADLYIGLS